MVLLSQPFLSLKKKDQQQHQGVGGVVVSVTSLRNGHFSVSGYTGVKVEIIVNILPKFYLLGLGILLGSLCGL